MSGSLKGTVKRKEYNIVRYDEKGNELLASNLSLSDDYKWAYPSGYQEIIRERDTIKYGFQFGKTFKILHLDLVF